MTLSAAHSETILNWKIVPRGKDYAMRVTAGGAGSTPTVDVVPEVLAAGTACDIYQDEYDLASDFNLFVHGLRTRREVGIPVISDERFRDRATTPAARGWPAARAVLIGPQKIRISHWDTVRNPIEYPYTYNPGDPSGTGAMTIEARLRALLAEMALPECLELKRGGAEANAARIRVWGQGGMMDEAKEVDAMRRRGGVHGTEGREQNDDGNPYG